MAAKIPASVLGDEEKLATALGETKAAYPALFGTRAVDSADGGVGAGKSGNPTNPGMNTFIRRAAGRA